MQLGTKVKCKVGGPVMVIDCYETGVFSDNKNVVRCKWWVEPVKLETHVTGGYFSNQWFGVDSLDIVSE